jgi:nucleoside-diphosphate-sugar epimerase
MSKTVLVTGGAGFFGSLLVQRLLQDGWDVVSIDLEKDVTTHARFTPIQGDIRDMPTLERVFAGRRFDAVFHCAAILAHAVKDKNFLWTSNVDGTRNVAEAARKHGVRKLVFTSSNCLWGEAMGRPVREDDPPNPVEIYGRSKWEGEKVLHAFERDIDVVIIRCPTIIEEGRLGLLAILFEFIDEGRKVWVVGGGTNLYQFIYARDLIDAFLRAADYKGSNLFHIGSDNVKTFREVYEHVIRQAGTGARVANFPRWIAIPLMKIAYALGLSPLGPYQYKMIAENFVFDTGKIKRELGWHPTLTNEQMLERAYRYYHDHRNEIEHRKGVSAHKQAAKMGVIRVLKWLS